MDLEIIGWIIFTPNMSNIFNCIALLYKLYNTKLISNLLQGYICSCNRQKIVIIYLCNLRKRGWGKYGELKRSTRTDERRIC